MRRYETVPVVDPPERPGHSYGPLFGCEACPHCGDSYCRMGPLYDRIRYRYSQRFMGRHRYDSQLNGWVPCDDCEGNVRDVILGYNPAAVMMLNGDRFAPEPYTATEYCEEQFGEGDPTGPGSPPGV